MKTDDYAGPCPCFAGMDAFVPRALKSCLASTSAVFEPEPPRAQQLLFPDFPVAHLGHTELMVVVVRSDIFMWALVKPGEML